MLYINRKDEYYVMFEWKKTLRSNTYKIRTKELPVPLFLNYILYSIFYAFAFSGMFTI